MSSCHHQMKLRSRWGTRWALALVLGLGLIVILSRRSGSQGSRTTNSDTEKWMMSPLWVEDQRPHVNPHRFRYIINEPQFCPDEEPVDLLILVTSSPQHNNRREAIRATWGKQSSISRLNTKVLFLLGQGQEGQGLIDTESDEFGDIVQEDFKDAYHNLTLKTVMGLKWTSIFCPQAKFIMKTDDDIFINVPKLSEALKKDDFSKITGCIKNSPQFGFTPLADPNNEVEIDPMQLPPAHPTFVAGAGYVIPGQIAYDLYIASLSTKLFPVEDVFITAHCAKRIGRHPPRHDYRFSCGHMVQDPCEMAKMFTGHKIEPEFQFTVMEKLEKNECQQPKHSLK